MGYTNPAKIINAKFKNLRRGLKLWAKSLTCLKKHIADINECIFLLDFFEEFRKLDTMEWNCSALLKDQLLTILKNQKIYWKLRGKVKGVKFGDENTKFFHTRASINYRHNKIAMLLNDDHIEITDHAGKARILWEAFKKRLGKSEGHSVHFDLENLLGQQINPDIFSDIENLF